MSVAILRFPGSNCEKETLDTLNYYNISAKIIDWTTPHNELRSFSGFIIPGGFSYQDRIRAGVIASKLDILNVLNEQSEEYNKPTYHQHGLHL